MYVCTYTCMHACMYSPPPPRPWYVCLFMYLLLSNMYCYVWLVICGIYHITYNNTVRVNAHCIPCKVAYFIKVGINYGFNIKAYYTTLQNLYLSKTVLHSRAGFRTGEAEQLPRALHNQRGLHVCLISFLFESVWYSRVG